MTQADLRKMLANRGRGRNGEPPRAIILQPAKKTPATVKLQPTESPLERRFAELWESLKGPPLVRQHRFAAPARQFRFDFAHLASKTAIELEGGVYGSYGHHVRPDGYQSDCEKYNLAAAMGWVVFRLTGRMIDAMNVTPIIKRTC